MKLSGAPDFDVKNQYACRDVWAWVSRASDRQERCSQRDEHWQEIPLHHSSQLHLDPDQLTIAGISLAHALFTRLQ